MVWLQQEGRGNGLAGKLVQLRMMLEHDTNTVEAYKMAGMPPERRSYNAAVDIYRDLGVVAPLRLLTHNPGKIEALKNAGFEVIIEPLVIEINSDMTARDLKAKKIELGHLYE